MHRSQKIKNNKPFNGFTTIEVMIVVVIGILILLIVFLAIPQLRRNVRDTHRKNYANLVIASANAYRSDSGGGLPYCTDSQTAGCAAAPGIASRFISNYLPKDSDPSTGQSWPTSSTTDGSTPFCGRAMLNATGSLAYCYSDRAGGFISHHTAPTEVGQIVIIENHTCCPCTSATDTGYAAGDTIGHGRVNVGSAGAWDLSGVVTVLVGLENGEYCVDNNGKQ